MDVDGNNTVSELYPYPCTSCISEFANTIGRRDAKVIGFVFDNFEYSVFPDVIVEPGYPKHLRIRQSERTKRARRVARRVAAIFRRRRLSAIAEDPLEHRDIAPESLRYHPDATATGDGENSQCQSAELRPATFQIKEATSGESIRVSNHSFFQKDEAL